MHLDKLYVVSDLHIGGPPGRRAFREAKALAWLIGEAASSKAGRVGLLLNGDIFDFLADPTNAREFATDAAQRIREYAVDADLKPIFEALKEYVETNKRFLILQGGNHDIEVALPSVQNVLLDIIDPARDAPGRIVFATDYRGFTFRVAGRMVLAVHGNQSDPWNAVDRRGLAEAARSEAMDRPVEAPVTNAGTILVVDVMNAVKERYPIVDLFKPEGAPLLAILDWLDPPKNRRGLLRAARRLLRRGSGGVRELLRADAGEELDELPTGGPGRDFVDFVSELAPAPRDSGALMERAEKHLRDGMSPRDLVVEGEGHLRAMGDAVLSRLPQLAGRVDGLKRPPELVLQQALNGWLARDRSFELDRLSELDEGIVESGRLGFDVLIAGHTHLARECSVGNLVYLNTGTWMRLLKLHGSPYLDEQFPAFLQAIDAPTYEALDGLDLDPRLRPVAIVDATSARLESVQEIDNVYVLRRLREGP